MKKWPMKPSIQIIYINGPSSSGKTTLAQALQEAFQDPFLHISLDKIIGMMPNKLNNWEGGLAPEGFSWKQAVDKDGHVLQEIQMGPYAKKMVQSLKEIVLTLASMGHNLIIDDVAFGNDEVQAWRVLLKEYKVLWIGLQVPVAYLEQRERERGNRIVGSSRAQYAQVHNNVCYDLEFDTAKEPLDDIVKAILEEFVKSYEQDSS
jgi:chloramphenicol 3-O phosphotransferase